MALKDIETASDNRRTASSSIIFFKIVFGIVLGVTILFLNIWRVWDFTVDDAFITLRYAKNLANGYGLVWNIGMDPVEGYTSFFYVVLMAFSHFVGLDIVLFSKYIGVLSAIGIVVLLFYHISFRLNSYRIASVIVVTFSMSSMVAVHAVSGMETMLFSFVLTFLAIMVFPFLSKDADGKNHPKKKFVTISLVGLFLPMIRPEGILLFSITIFVLYSYMRHSGRQRLLTYIFFITVLPGLSYFIWRWSYFGYLFPNTFYAKITLSKQLLQPQSIGYCLSFFEHIKLEEIILLSIVNFILVVFLKNKKTYLCSDRVFNRYSLFLLSSFFLFSAIYLVVNTDIMGFVYRFLMPIYPLFLLYAAQSMRQIVNTVSKAVEKLRYPRKISYRLTSLPLFFCFFFILNWPFDNGIDFGIEWANNYAKGLNESHIYIGKMLNLLPNGRLAVLADAGAIPFYSNWETLDAGGLNDEYLTHHNFDPEYVFDFNPDIFIVTSFSYDSFTTPWLYDEILKSASEFKDYQLLGKYFFDQNYWEFVYIRSDAEYLNSLRRYLATPDLKWELYSNIPDSHMENGVISGMSRDYIQMRFPLLDPNQGDNIRMQRIVQTQPGKCYRIGIDIEDSYLAMGNEDVFAQQVYFGTEKVWEHDISKGGFVGWQHFSESYYAEQNELTIAVMLKAIGDPVPGSWWGDAARIGVSNFFVEREDTCP